MCVPASVPILQTTPTITSLRNPQPGSRLAEIIVASMGCGVAPEWTGPTFEEIPLQWDTAFQYEPAPARLSTEFLQRAAQILFDRDVKVARLGEIPKCKPTQEWHSVFSDQDISSVINAETHRPAYNKALVGKLYQHSSSTLTGNVGWLCNGWSRSGNMPRLYKNFCPHCVELVSTRQTQGVYLPIEHECPAVRVYNPNGVLLHTVTFDRAKLDVAQSKRKESQPTAKVAFKASRSREWRQTHSPMAKLIRLCVEREVKDAYIWSAVESMPYRAALRYLQAHQRWVMEKAMVAKGHPNAPYEARALQAILQESRTFPN
jgi:hypothetical protein